MLTAANRPVATSLIATPTLTGCPPSVSGWPVIDIRPPDRLRDEVVARLVRVRPVRPEPRDREMDEIRVDRLEGRVVEAEPREAADAGVLDDHVRGPQEASQDVAPGVGLEVEADRALVPVDGEVVRRGPRPGRPRRRRTAGPRSGSRRPPGGSTLTTSAPRSARSIVANGPARTVEQSAIRMPTSGPGGVAARLPGSGVGLGAIGSMVAAVSPGPDRERGPRSARRRPAAARAAARNVMSTTCAPVARIRSAGARWTLTPRAPPPIATRSSASMLASAMTGHGRRAPNGVIAPRT